MAGLIDVDAELARLIGKLRKVLWKPKLSGKLGNASLSTMHLKR